MKPHRSDRQGPESHSGSQSLPVLRAREMLVAALAALIAYGILRPGSPLAPYEAGTVDMRFHLRGPIQPDPLVVIVAIDEQTLSAFRKQGYSRLDEWPRETHARLMDRLTRAGARVVGWDVTFDAPSRTPGDDRKLADALRRAGMTVLPMYYGLNAAEGGEGDRTMTPDAGMARWLQTHGLDLPQMPDQPRNAYGWVLPTEPLRDAAADLGYVDTSPETDGVYRRIALCQGDSFGRWREHLALAMFRLYAESKDGSVQDRRTLDAVEAAPDRLRMINFAGRPGAISRISYDDVLAGQFNPSAVRGKLVLVGLTGPSGDLRPNPYSSTANGVEITANALGSLLQNRFMNRVEGLLTFLTEFIMAVAAVCLVSALAPSYALLVLAFLAVFYCAVTQWAFVHADMAFVTLGPLVAIVLAAAGAFYYRLADEELARRKIEAHWKSYVGPDVLEEILSNPGLDAGQGVRVEATVVFSDIRGYSTLSEKLEPEAVIQQINEHFEEMTLLVFACGGTVLGVTGDGLLMVFGWPRAYPDHANRAVMACRAIAEGLNAVNEKWASEGRPTIDIGLGIHTGTIVAGRVGGEQGSQLTVIGDTVNVAARVQDLNKQLKTRILMTEETRSRLEPPVRVGIVETVPVKGREAPVVVYEVQHRKNVRSE